MPKIRNFTVLPALPEPLKKLEVIAKNMYWSWEPEFIDLFKRIDSNLWRASRYNPVKLLGSVSQEHLESLAENKGFLYELERVASKLETYLESPTWFEKYGEESSEPFIAYFSAEFGLHESVPIYSGGLGILAGDHLKSASDLGIPLVGVGLMYQKGYFRQYLNIDGWQQEVYIENDFYNMPVELIKGSQGGPLIIEVDYPGETIQAQIWAIAVGRIKLYLLDTNIVSNSPQARMITANLYGGDREMRIRQEIMLGIGGLRALRAMDISPKVCHMNEGHAAFMSLERIKNLREETGITFEQALEATKAGNAFTVHTPVAAGNDEFSVELIEKYFSSYYPGLGIDKKEFLGLGRLNMEDNNEPFKMPVLAIKLSSYRNGVSKLHGEVSREMWAGLWPEVPVSEVPITSVTNGTHIKSWLSHELTSLYDRYLGVNWHDEVTDRSLWNNIDSIPDEEFWRTHQRSKGRLVAFARSRLKSQIQRRGTYHTELNWADEVLDSEALTIGFARRFATYKRGNLLLRDPKRLIKLLSDPERPLQIVFAGKAHPRDTEGKEIIRQIIHFANQYDVRKRIVFLEDYDINVARFLVRGVDVWLNTPRPPMEASGTSGMKAAFNGALNLSTWDGWWCEGYVNEGGWVIGAGESYDDPEYQDMVESQAMYNILENEVIPLYYSRGKNDLPRPWIHRMKTTIKWCTPRFNTSRMVGEYTKRFYMMAAEDWKELNGKSQAKAKEISTWKSYMKQHWGQLQIADVDIKVDNGNGFETQDQRKSQIKVGSKLRVKALVRLGDIAPENISVQLYRGQVDSWGNIIDGTILEMAYKEPANEDKLHWFEGVMVCDSSGRQGVAVRLLPKYDGMACPHGLNLICWELQNNQTAAKVN